MMMLLSIVALISAIVTIYAKMREKKLPQYIFKPLTMLAIILIAVFDSPAPPSFYRNAILIGLIFSTIGDVLLIDSKKFFVFGLIGFLLAHLCYSAAFLNHSISSHIINYAAFAAIIYLIYCGILLKILWTSLNNLKIPVIIYSFVLTMMSWLALSQYLSNAALSALWAFLGSALFVASDSMLAYNKFKKPLPFSAVWILGTYFPAQWLIALSIVSF